ncbi:MAG: efflux RND transporter permease subunit [Caldisericaceae bacterium]|nr:efflux RND transporter permease subunit [Caldisericaceae bacterium]
MKLVEISIRKRVTLSMIYLIIIGFALFSFSQLKIDLFPDIDFPVVGIISQYSGVGPEDMENLIARPIEEAVSATKNVKKVSSQVSQGVCITLLEFDWGTDIDQAENDVRKRIDLVRDYLPDEASEPLTFAFDPSMMPINFILINSPTMGPAELRQLGEDRIEPLLERVEGVASVETQGGLQRQINVRLNPIKLAAHHLSPVDVTRAIRAAGGLFPAGSIETSTTNFNLHIASDFSSIEQLKNVVLKYEKGIPLLLKEVAEVEDGFKELRSDVRVNYNQGVYMRVFKQSDANTVQACRNVKNAIKEIKDFLPRDVELKIVYDQSEYILRSVGNLGNTAVLAFFIAFAVIYFFLRNLRGSIIMGLAIPISVIATFAVMMLANLTLNIISMAGLALAIGMLVDNSIVVLENIYRHRELGFDRPEAANIGASEVGMAITASTLTTIGVFLPVLFVPGIAGELFNDMVVTITFSLFASLIIALTLVPMLSARILKTESEMQKIRLAKFKNQITSFLERLSSRYQKVLHWSLKHKKIVIGLTSLLFIFSLLLLPFIGGEFLPKSDQGFIALTVLREKGTPLDQTRKTVLQLEQVIKEEIPEATDVLAIFGAGEGIFALFGGSGSEAINFRVRLTPMEERNRSQTEIEDAFRKRLDEIPGITYQFIQQGMISTERAIEVKIFGHDLAQAKQIAHQLKDRMEKIEGLVDIDINMKEGGRELRIVPDINRLNDLKLSPFLVADMISTAIQGKVAARYREAGDEYDILVQLDKPYRQSRDALKRLLIPTLNGKMIPLEQVAQIVEDDAPSTIYRENQERFVSVGCDLSGIDLSSAVRKISATIDGMNIPGEFQVVIGGTAEDQQESFFYLTIAFFAAILLVYMIMASQFESLVDPFIIMFTVPLSIIGVLWALFLTGTTLSVMALVGIVMLVGIVVNNGIVLVDYVNQLRHKGKALYEAVEEGGRVRMRPVLMTAMTTILGMVPLALELGSGSENWSPLARAVIGGLTTSTLLTLIIVPVLYVIFEQVGNRVRQWWQKI